MIVLIAYIKDFIICFVTTQLCRLLGTLLAKRNRRLIKGLSIRVKVDTKSSKK